MPIMCENMTCNITATCSCTFLSLFDHINISVSFAFFRGGTCEEEPQTGEYRCFILSLFFPLHHHWFIIKSSPCCFWLLLLIVCDIGLMFKRGFTMSLLGQRENLLCTSMQTVKPCGWGWEDGVHPWEEGWFYWSHGHPVIAL